MLLEKNNILHGRPNSDSEYVFLTTKSPYVKLSDRTTSIVQRNMEKAGLPKKKNLRRGFHSFRRSLGTQMLKAEVALETISQVLGHSSTEATKPYLSIDLTHLKECALDLSTFSCLRGELC
jgi:integrase